MDMEDRQFVETTEPARLPRRAILEGAVPLTLEEVENLIAVEESAGRGDTQYTRALEARKKELKEMGS